MELFILLQSLVDTVNPVEQGLSVTRAVSDYGIMVVTAAFFVLISIINMWSNNKRYDKILKQNEDRYEALFKQYLEGSTSSDLIDKTTVLINAVNNLIVPLDKLLTTTSEIYKEECTYQQVVRIVKSESKLSRYLLIEDVESIKDHILPEPISESRILKLVVNQKDELKNNLNLYKFKGVVLGNFIKDRWDQNLVNLVKSYLQNQISFDDMVKELDMYFNEMYNYFISEIRELK